MVRDLYTYSSYRSLINWLVNAFIAAAITFTPNTRKVDDNDNALSQVNRDREARNRMNRSELKRTELVGEQTETGWVNLVRWWSGDSSCNRRKWRLGDLPNPQAQLKLNEWEAAGREGRGASCISNDFATWVRCYCCCIYALSNS